LRRIGAIGVRQENTPYLGEIRGLPTVLPLPLLFASELTMNLKHYFTRKPLNKQVLSPFLGKLACPGIPGPGAIDFCPIPKLLV
jgi:hypothetical protein